MKRLLVLALLLFASTVNAATHTAASVALSDVQAAYALCASSGDILAIPAGSATWTSQFAVSGKALTIQGAGSGSTLITMSYSTDAIFKVTCNATNFVRVTGIGFILGSGVNSNGAIQFFGTSTTGTREVGFRYDNCAATFSTISGRAHGIFYVWGLIDHNTFTQTSGAQMQFFQLYGSNDGGDCGNTPWSFALTPGTANAVYFENNTFDQRGCTQGDDFIDAYGGAYPVIRYNTFYDCSQGFHGMDSGSRRSCLGFEIYNNTYTNNSSVGGGYRLRRLTVRGGTGVVFNNTYNGTQTWNEVTLQYFRAYQTTPAISFQICDGTTYYMPTSGAAPLVTSGGRGFDDTFNRTLGTNGAGFTNKVDGPLAATGYPGRDQPGYAPGMVSTPIYVWNNTGGNNTARFAGGNPSDETKLAVFIQVNRDWVTGSAKPGYTSYTYPYPLAAIPTLSSATINSAGTNLADVFSLSCTTGSGGSGGMKITIASVDYTGTYSSGSGSTTYNFTVAKVYQGATVTVTYTQPGNGIEATSDGTDVASFSAQAVTNSSTQVIPVPTSPGVTPTGQNTTTVNWTDASGGITSFKIYRSLTNGSFVQIGTAGAGATTYNDSGLAAGTQYYYTVASTAQGLTSSQTSSVNTTTDPSVAPNFPVLRSPAYLGAGNN